MKNYGYDWDWSSFGELKKFVKGDPIILDKIRAFLAKLDHLDGSWVTSIFFSAEQVGEILSKKELVDLIKGLIRFQKINGAFGSPTPAAKLFLHFANKYPNEEEDLCKWILDNRVNEYDPFGTFKDFGAKSLKEYHELQYRPDPEKAKQSLENARLQREARELKKIRELKIATQNLYNAVRRGDVLAVKALLARGADWKSVIAESGSLIDLARANGRINMIKFLEDNQFTE
jgi:hypothetical protein